MSRTACLILLALVGGMSQASATTGKKVGKGVNALRQFRKDVVVLTGEWRNQTGKIRIKSFSDFVASRLYGDWMANGQKAEGLTAYFKRKGLSHLYFFAEKGTLRPRDEKPALGKKKVTSSEIPVSSKDGIQHVIDPFTKGHKVGTGVFSKGSNPPLTDPLVIVDGLQLNRLFDLSKSPYAFERDRTFIHRR